MTNSVIDVSKLKILIVDDDTTFLDVLEALLQSLGVKSITRAASGIDAVNKMKELASSVDVVLCDYSMANGSGLELLQAIRLGQLKFFRPDVCFVLLTSSSAPMVVQTARNLDANGYILKPVTAQKLQDAIVKARSRYFAIDRNKYAEVIVPAAQQPQA